MSEDKTTNDPPLSNRLFAKRAAIIAGQAAAWASSALAEDVSGPFSAESAERFSAEIKRVLRIIVMDAKANSR